MLSRTPRSSSLQVGGGHFHPLTCFRGGPCWTKHILLSIDTKGFSHLSLFGWVEPGRPLASATGITSGGKGKCEEKYPRQLWPRPAGVSRLSAWAWCICQQPGQHAQQQFHGTWPESSCMLRWFSFVELGTIESFSFTHFRVLQTTHYVSTDTSCACRICTVNDVTVSLASYCSVSPVSGNFAWCPMPWGGKMWSLYKVTFCKQNTFILRCINSEFCKTKNVYIHV